MAEGMSQEVSIRATTNALERHFTALVKVIDPLLLCNDLCTREIIDSSTLDEIITDSTKTKEEKASDTLKAVAHKLHTDSDVFRKFCDLLLSDPATKECAKPLKRSYEESLVEELFKVSTIAQFVKVCKKESLFESGATFVVRSRNSELWQAVLKNEDEQCRRSFVDKIVQTAISDTQDPDAISVAVKSFMLADMPNDLIKLLEVILLNSTFKENSNLQNLLILTAIKSDQSRVMEYIGRLDNYSGLDIAGICISSGLFEEAFTIFKKFDESTSAMEVLIQHMGNLDRASEFAGNCNKQAVWSLLAKAQLDAQCLKDSIRSYIKAKDASTYKEVVAAAKTKGNFGDLIDYLRMARDFKKESFIDTELVFALAKTDRLNNVKEVLSGPNLADVQMLRERCAKEKLDTVCMLLN